MTPSIEFRPIRKEDHDFLYSVYASTREEELALVDWSDEQKQQFLHMQFTAQHSYYQENYANAQFDVILVDGQPRGRLYVDRRDNEIRVVDIALLPHYRGRGIGGRIMRDILSEGRKTTRTVSIHVEQNNRALRFYQRLGFKQVGATGIYLLLEWTPETACHASKPGDE